MNILVSATQIAIATSLGIFSLLVIPLDFWLDAHQNLSLARAATPIDSGNPPPPPSDLSRHSDDLPSNSCQQADNPELSSIRPLESKASLTIRNTPTLLFYVPYSANTIQKGEFVLQTRSLEDVYQVDFEIPVTPGFVSIQLPQPTTAEVSYLEPNQYYRYFFTVTCVTETEEVLDRTVEGWVKRVIPGSQEIGDPIYYDELADSFASVPEQWQSLLKVLGLEEYSNIPTN